MRKGDVVSFAPLVPLVTAEEWRRMFPTGVRGQETVSLDVKFPGVECPPEEDMARQEYKESSDLRYQVERFGVGVHRPNYGAFDTDVDLDVAFALIEKADSAWLGLPAAVRERYANWREVEAAAVSGELTQVLKAAGVTVGGSAGAPAASTSPEGASGSQPKAG